MMRPSEHDGYDLEDDGPGGADETGYGQAPPTYAGPIERGRVDSAWPTVFGVIGIILSAWGVISSGCGLLFFAGVGGAMGFGQFSQQMQGAGVTGAALASGIVKASIGLGLAVYLLYASIALLKRTGTSPAHMTRWAWLRVVAFFLTTILEIATTNFAMLQQQAGQAGAGIVIGMIVAGVAVGMLFSLWFPVLTLIWFRRPVIREEVARWI